MQDLAGLKFGRWTVLSFSHLSGTASYWNCICECGAQKAIWGSDLKRGMSKSCGCLARELRRERTTSHGMTDHPAHRQWISMKQRCYNDRSNDYQWYGARGIKVCKQWLNSFEAFWKDMGPSFKDGLTLDRQRVDENYSPDNCRWATRKEQARNRRTNRIINTPNGPMVLMEAAEKYGIDYRTVYARIAAGWNTNDVFLMPVRRGCK